MNIRELKAGDRFEVVRTKRKYTFLRYSSAVRPKDCIAQRASDKQLIYIDLRTKIRSVEDEI